MLIVGLVGGLLAGLMAGGRLDHLASVRLRWMAVLFGGLVLRFARARPARIIDRADRRTVDPMR